MGHRVNFGLPFLFCVAGQDDLPVGTELYFNIDEARKQYRRSDVGSQFAQECIARLEAGGVVRR